MSGRTILARVLEAGVVAEQVAIDRGLDHGLKAGQPIAFLDRKGKPTGSGSIWFALDGLASVRIHAGDPQVGDVALVVAEEEHP